MTFNQIETIKESLRSKIQQAEDVVFKELHTKDKYIEILFIKSISIENVLQSNLIKPFFEISTNDWEEWQQIYPNITFKVDSKVQITDTGLIE